ncbi:MAG: hypothetical protein FWG03_03465 [Clostridiales bacterium]|nr:hypothetical protein [Clostridiales bacterium]
MNKFLNKMKNQDKVINFMGGVSFTVNPLDTLKMISASSIFGEPSYYRTGEFETGRVRDAAYAVHKLFMKYSIIDDEYKGMKTSEIMEKAIDEALDYDYGATLRWAVTLRQDYLMRLNPQVLMVRAAAHPGRAEFTRQNPGVFADINRQVMARADEPATQLTYWLYRNDRSKKGIPGILKRSWAEKLSSLSRYELFKYRNAGLGIIDTVRVCHANSGDIDELMRTGTIAMGEEDLTWEALRSSGKKWKKILKTIEIPHMALLRNLRGIFTEIKDVGLCKELMEKLKGGVAKGKQFPFRYWSAMKAVGADGVNHQSIILDALEECVDIAAEQLPCLAGKTMCLSDNSGSAWGAFNSEYGTVTVAEIDNLSSVITAIKSEDGYVGKFGDELIVTPVLKRNGILSQSGAITENRQTDVGGSTENGIWLFFDNAIENKEHWDNIFIYSDQQAGHGGLYGTGEGKKDYKAKGFEYNNYVDVAKLIAAYRKKVNPKVNVFSIQTAGYTNVCIPEYGYRTNILYGWTGKELLFAKAMIDFWDGIDTRENQET